MLGNDPSTTPLLGTNPSRARASSAFRICWWTEQAGQAKDKVSLARRLRHETTMTLNWIAERLNLGAVGPMTNLLRDTEWK
jgi:hypothetical protein